MYYYKIADLIVESARELSSYYDFLCEPSKADVTVTETGKLPPPGSEVVSRAIAHRRIDGGWFFHDESTEKRGLYVSGDYSQLQILGTNDPMVMGFINESEWFIRLAIECMLTKRGYISLHAAAVEMQGKAYAFSGPSGIGKSTRANAWKEAFGAELINGDRPLIDTYKLELYGVPWDGKEQCFRNVHYPLKAICEVRRSESAYIREMNFNQRRKLLLQQSFLPMWDTETAFIQMANIARLAAHAEMVRIFSGPSSEDAGTLFSAFDNHNYLMEKRDMKAKQGFVLRNVADEYILMPTGGNIGKFNGTILLNEVSAFVWEKLHNSLSRDDLLKAILDEFEVEKDVAAADLDTILATLKEYNVIEDD